MGRLNGKVSCQFAEEVRDEADDLAVAVWRLRVGEAAQRRRRVEARALRLHLGRLASLRLRELRRDHDQAQVDHEERPDLGSREASLFVRPKSKPTCELP